MNYCNPYGSKEYQNQKKQKVLKKLKNKFVAFKKKELFPSLKWKILLIKNSLVGITNSR